jgi:four helix bundle protein
MRIERFEDIEAWKEGRLLVADVYEALSKVKDFGFRDQIQRAAVSITSNIAEGFDRGSNKEFIQFLIFARGSASEVRSQAYNALDLGYIDPKAFEKLSAGCTAVSNLINGFIRYLRNSDRQH